MRRSKDWVQPIPTLDLVKFCRDQDTVLTTVTMHWSFERQFVWLKLAQIRLHARNNSHFPGEWYLDAYLGNHADFEGDSAFIINLPLIGVQFEHIRYGQTSLSGFVNPNLDGYDTFAVPGPDYNPFEVTSESDAKRPKYTPGDNRELYKQVRGKRVSILTGTLG